MVGSQVRASRGRVGGVAALAVGAAAAAALALLVVVLGYLGSLPFGAAPGADAQQGPNLYVPLATLWAVAAAAALFAAVTARRRPALSVILAVLALAAGFAAPLLLAPKGDRPITVIAGLLAWLVPACALALGAVALAPRTRSEVKP